MSNIDKSTLTTATVTSFLAEFAETWSKEKDLKSKLASSLIYANLAEFLADDIIFWVRNRIDDKLRGENFKLVKYKPSSNTSLESSIKRLKKLDFPNKDALLNLLKMVQESRNNLFHSLLVVHRKNLDVDAIIENIKTNTNEIIKVHAEILDKDTVIKAVLSIVKSKR